MNERKLIMCVEDDPDNARLIDFLLRRAPADLVMTNRADDAAALWSGRRPDLILLDLVLPGSAGLDWLESLRRQETLAPTPVIIVSVRTDPEQLRRARELGSEYYVLKPFTPEVLREAIEKALGVDWHEY